LPEILFLYDQIEKTAEEKDLSQISFLLPKKDACKYFEAKPDDIGLKPTARGSQPG
jgi:hypothetical protein